MKKTVLDVGNCSIDHAAIQQMLAEQFDVEVFRAADLKEALESLRARAVDLVLVNRRLHGDYEEGVEVIRRMKADPSLAGTPVMLVSDLPASQESAVAIGAAPGFGKSQLASPDTVAKLRRFLG